MNGTLTRKLFSRIIPTILITIVAIGGFAFHSATHEINTMYDAQLINDANVLWTLLQSEFEAVQENTSKQVDDIDFKLDNQMALNQDADDYADAHMFRAWKAGKIVMFSSTAFAPDIPQQKPGFSNVIYKKEQWRVYTLPIPNKSFLIEVGEKTALRDTLVSNILLNLFFPLLVLVPIITALVWFGINNGLATIRALVKQIRSRSPDDLSPVSVDHLPHDLSPLGISINQLLAKLEHSLTAERRFTDHAAHQLRTPQAQLKLLLQMFSRADNEEERQAITADLMASNEQATQMIEQLLHLARVSHQPVKFQPTRLYPLVASVIAEMGGIISKKQLDIELEGENKALAHADESMLKLMVSNLIENAAKYTPPHGKIQVNITPADDMWRLSISDSGPGIPESQREAVFRRFYRVGIPQAEGSGLGLAIVADIIHRLNGSITLKTPPSGGGLLVEVLLQKT